MSKDETIKGVCPICGSRYMGNGVLPCIECEAEEPMRDLIREAMEAIRTLAKGEHERR